MYLVLQLGKRFKMLSLYDDKVKGEEYFFYLIFDFIKVETLDIAMRRQERLLNHDFNFWDKEDKTIFLIVVKIDEVYKDGSYSYEDIKKEKVEYIG